MLRYALKHHVTQISEQCICENYNTITDIPHIHIGVLPHYFMEAAQHHTYIVEHCKAISSQKNVTYSYINFCLLEKNGCTKLHKF